LVHALVNNVVRYELSLGLPLSRPYELCYIIPSKNYLHLSFVLFLKSQKMSADIVAVDYSFLIQNLPYPAMRIAVNLQRKKIFFVI